MQWRSAPSDLVAFDDGGGSVYLALEPAVGARVRSSEATVDALLDASGEIVAFELPRRGAGYEITYPSGNR